MTTIARSLADVCTRRPWLTIGGWVLTAIALLALATSLGARYADDVSVPGSDSAAANALLASSSDGAGSSLLLAAPTPLTDPASAGVLDTTLADVAAALGIDVPNPLADPQRAAATGRLSPDRLAVSVPLEVDTGNLTRDQMDAAEAALDAHLVDGWDGAFAGELARSMDRGPQHRSEIIGVAAAIIVLTIGLGSLAAMSVPLVAGIVAVAGGLGCLSMLSHATSIPEIAPTLATMIGLGVGIDYALFEVTRLRQALASGASVREAVAVTAASAGTAALFAGTTVALSICALSISGVAFIGWLGYASALLVVVVVLSALTFTPALLTVLAPRLTPSPKRAATVGGGSARLAGHVLARPWLLGGAGLVLLGLLAAPAASLELGTTSPGDRPHGTQSRESFDIRAEHFGPGTNASLAVAVTLDTPSSGPDDPRLVALNEALTSAGGASTTPLAPLASGSLIASAQVVPTAGANDSSTAALVRDLRAIEAPEGTSLHVGGATATRLDLADRVTARLPWLMVAVVIASMLVLVLAFRSVVIPLKAAAMNLLSVGASYGVVVAVFQWGWGASLVGLDGPVAIDSFVPMILFTVLFGLSTDYEVFLVSSMRETWDATRDARRAVADGMRHTGRVITTAAVIMIAVFLSFVTQQDPTIKIFGLGLAASILIDATLIRMVVVPAIMAVLGERAWYLPRWLDRILPSIDLHGEPTPPPVSAPVAAPARP